MPGSSRPTLFTQQVQASHRYLVRSSGKERERERERKKEAGRKEFIAQSKRNNTVVFILLTPSGSRKTRRAEDIFSLYTLNISKQVMMIFMMNTTSLMS